VASLQYSLSKKPRCFTQTLSKAQEQVGAPKYSFWVSNPPKKFPMYATLMSYVIDTEPSSFEEAFVGRVWRDAMTKEYNSNLKNDVWEIVPRAIQKFVINSRWLFKIKHVVNGSKEKYKVRFITRGLSQKEGVYYKDNSAHVARYTSIKVLMSITSCFGWPLYQMDINTIFINGVIKEVIKEEYIMQKNIHI